MKKFLIIILLSVGIPIALLLTLYLYTDPFKTLHAFDVTDIDDVNREYASTELFLLNKDKYNYDSFVFSSSRGCGINTYTWQMYLPEGSQPFLFQAWTETLSGMVDKITFINENGLDINNALFLIDIPTTFSKEQYSKEMLSIKHYKLMHQSKFSYNAILFYDYCQKPSLWISRAKKKLTHSKLSYNVDLVTNDWNKDAKTCYDVLLPQDSLSNCSSISRQTFLYEVANLSVDDIKESEPLITDEFVNQLKRLRAILDKNETDYHIIITPAYCYKHPYINSADLAQLQQVFGNDRVHNYSGLNEINTDYNNFTDPNHFGYRVGYLLLKDIYDKETIEMTTEEY